MDLSTHNQRVPSSGKLRFINQSQQPRVLNSNGRVFRLRPESGTPVHAETATGTLTGTTIANGDTVTIGGYTYTFVAALSEDSGDAVPFEVLVGVSDSASLDNLIAAINGAAGEGTTYGTGTTAHAFVTAAAGAGDTMDVTFNTPGAAGNIATTASLTAGGWGDTTLTGGVDATTGSAGDQLYDEDFLYTAITDVDATSTSGWNKSAIAPI